MTLPPSPPGRPLPVPTPVRPLDPARLRAWLAAALAVLLVLTYLSVEWTYSSSHLPPPRFHPVAPGAVAHGTYADFRLLSLRRTEHWGHDTDGQPASPDPGAVWVVAELEITPRRHQDYVLCTSSIVATDGRSWAPVDLGPVHEGESCAPDEDDEPVQLGTTYPFVAAYEVPEPEADHIAGIGIETYTWHAQPLLRPPA
jgi:hypothetical protein